MSHRRHRRPPSLAALGAAAAVCAAVVAALVPPRLTATPATDANASAPRRTPAPHAIDAPHAAASPPRLVVLLVVDQLRADYLDRWRAQFTGGFARLLDHGHRFTAVHDHGITETAPGHATLLSGRFPVHTGITDNAGGVNGGPWALVDALGVPASPQAFRGTTLADWLQDAHPGARVLSVSRKDRGAILPVGRGRFDVYWYAPAAGVFTTSTWYADTLPAWLRALNSASPVFAQAGRSWTPLLADSAYAEPDSQPAESGGRTFTFPHALPRDSFTLANVIIGHPVMDSITWVVAEAGMRALAIGADTVPDLLVVSFSATDAVGHRFGPDSRELHDQVLRLDRTIGALLDTLDARIGLEHVLVALSADHGVSPIPVQTNRIGSDVFAKAATAAATVAARQRIPPEALGFDGRLLVVDTTVVPAGTKGRLEVARAFAREAAKIPGIARADALDDLARRDTVRDVVARRWLHTVHPGGAVLAVVTYADDAVMSNAPVATHGNPSDADATVPMLLMGPGVAAGVTADTVRTVDLAPTLARLLGLTPAEPLDGRALPTGR